MFIFIKFSYFLIWVSGNSTNFSQIKLLFFIHNIHAHHTHRVKTIIYLIIEGSSLGANRVRLRGAKPPKNLRNVSQKRRSQKWYHKHFLAFALPQKISDIFCAYGNYLINYEHELCTSKMFYTDTHKIRSFADFLSKRPINISMFHVPNLTNEIYFLPKCNILTSLFVIRT